MTIAEHLNPFFTRRVTLDSALTPSQCAERLRAQVASEMKFWASEKPFRGRVGEEKFTLHRFRWVRQSLPVEVRGTFEQGGAGGRGTRVELAIGWRREDSIAAVVGLAGAQVALLVARSTADPPPPWLGWLLVPVVILGLLLAAATTRGEDDWLVNQLSKLFEATDVTPIS